MFGTLDGLLVRWLIALPFRGERLTVTAAYAAAAASLALVGAAAWLLPVLHAMRVDPATTLRQE